MERSVLRRGLPRVRGGEAWPPTGEGSAPARSEEPPTGGGTPGEAVVRSAAEPAPPAERSDASSQTDASGALGRELRPVSRSVRRGLPRIPGGDRWPPVEAEDAEPVGVSVVESDPGTGPAGATPERRGTPAPPAPSTLQSAATDAAPYAPERPVSDPSPVAVPIQRTPGEDADPALASETAPGVARSTPAEGRAGRLIRRAALWCIASVLAAGIIVLAARGVTTLPGVPGFLHRFPGEYEPRAHVDAGFPAWARWSHFLNFFFMVLIVRTGLLVRHQQKPPAFFVPRRGGKKISIYLWLHTAIDLLWLANGAVFVVLLFVSGHWARIVPTSWEVFPNAASAMLQYLTLDWPVEDGWVNYNSLQQLMYFLIVFVAAPLAAISGARMSEWWPKGAERLNRVYPAPVARAIHFPVMLGFVLFAVIHVFLVLSTGALRNLNHMFAGTDQAGWVGFGWFAAGLLATAAVTWAARPLVLAPIAGAFGRVSER